MAAKTSNKPVPTPHQVLVVDDHPRILELMTDLLEGEGHEVVTARDAIEALEKLESLRPKFIFIDLVMPYIRGDQLCRIIRELPHQSKAKIIILSAIAAEAPDDFSTYGADACVAKGPFKEMTRHVLGLLSRLALDQPSEMGNQVLGCENLFERQITKELLTIQKHTRSILDILHEGLLELTPQGKVIFANAVAFQILGIPEEKLLAASFPALFEPAARKKIKRFLQRKGKAADQLPSEPDLSVRFGDQELALKFLPLGQKENPLHVVTLQDITRQKEMEAALQQSQKRCHLLFNRMDSGFALLEPMARPSPGQKQNYCFGEANPAFERITGLSREQLLRRPLERVFLNPEGFWAAIFQKVIATAPFQRLEIQHREQEKYYEITAYTPKEGQFAVFFYDITERKLLEKKLEEASITDDLTRVLNRRGFLTLADKQLRIAARGMGELYLLFADIDNLKWINDHLGHPTGDRAVQEMAELLQETFRESDIVGRLGGDEFAVLLTGKPGKDLEEAVPRRLESCLRKRNERARGYELSLSHGLVRYDPENPLTLHELLTRADHLMYAIKERKHRARGG